MKNKALDKLNRGKRELNVFVKIFAVFVLISAATVFLTNAVEVVNSKIVVNASMRTVYGLVCIVVAYSALYGWFSKRK